MAPTGSDFPSAPLRSLRGGERRRGRKGGGCFCLGGDRACCWEPGSLSHVVSLEVKDLPAFPPSFRPPTFQTSAAPPGQVLDFSLSPSPPLLSVSAEALAGWSPPSAPAGQAAAALLHLLPAPRTAPARPPPPPRLPDEASLLRWLEEPGAPPPRRPQPEKGPWPQGERGSRSPGAALGDLPWREGRARCNSPRSFWKLCGCGGGESTHPTAPLEDLPPRSWSGWWWGRAAAASPSGREGFLPCRAP